MKPRVIVCVHSRDKVLRESANHALATKNSLSGFIFPTELL